MLSGESIGEFGDRRLARRGSIVFNRIVATGSLVQRRVGKSRAGELGMARFLESPAVSKEAIVATIAARKRMAAWVFSALMVAQDTTEAFCERKAGRWDLVSGDDQSRVSDHARRAVMWRRTAVLGLADATSWKRGWVKVLRIRRLDGEGIASLADDDADRGRSVGGCRAGDRGG
jgi:hypothetical protein